MPSRFVKVGDAAAAELWGTEYIIFLNVFLCASILASPELISAAARLAREAQNSMLVCVLREALFSGLAEFA